MRVRTVYLVTSDTLGRGSEELGAVLMVSFLRKLWAAPVKPEAIVFYNAGVKLLAEGAPALDAIDGLARAGVDLAACGTCIKHFGLGERLHAGRVSDMQEIVGLLGAAEKVVTV
jgi:selenium metabolism protein YedF